LELEVACALSGDEALPYDDIRRREIVRKPLVGPGVAIRPLPSFADGAIELPVLIHGDSIAA